MALLNTFPLDAKTYEFEWLRRFLKMTPVQAGVLDPGDFKVTDGAGADLKVDIAAGAALVQAATGFRNELYLQINDAAVANAVTLDAAHATLPRVDAIILQLNDSDDLGDASDTPLFDKVTGVPTSGATNDNGLGASGPGGTGPALPNDCLLLGWVLVPAAATSLAAGNIRDRRRWARGAHRRIRRTSNAGGTDNYSFSNTAAFADIDATNLKARLECAGSTVEIVVSGVMLHSMGGDQPVNLRAAQDWATGGAGFDNEAVGRAFRLGTVNDTAFEARWAGQPAVGSHVFTLQGKVNNPSGQLYARADLPLYFTIRELVLQDASND